MLPGSFVHHLTELTGGWCSSMFRSRNSCANSCANSLCELIVEEMVSLVRADGRIAIFEADISGQIFDPPFPTWTLTEAYSAYSRAKGVVFMSVDGRWSVREAGVRDNSLGQGLPHRWPAGVR